MTDNKKPEDNETNSENIQRLEKLFNSTGKKLALKIDETEKNTKDALQDQSDALIYRIRQLQTPHDEDGVVIESQNINIFKDLEKWQRAITTKSNSMLHGIYIISCVLFVVAGILIQHQFGLISATEYQAERLWAQYGKKITECENEATRLQMEGVCKIDIKP